MKILRIQNNNIENNLPALKKHESKPNFTQYADTCSFTSSRSKLLKLKYIDEFIANMLNIGEIRKNTAGNLTTNIETSTANEEMYQQILAYATKNSNLSPLIVEITHPNRVNKFNKLVSTRAQELNPELKQVHQELRNSYLKQFTSDSFRDNNRIEKDAQEYANKKLLNYMDGTFNID